MSCCKKKKLGLAAALWLVFAVFTFALTVFDVQPIGPLGSSVGFASLNSSFAATVGSEAWFKLTETITALSLLPPLIFGALGLKQMLQRKSLLKVDADILLLGVFYVAVVAFYIGFDIIAINYRPVLMEGVLEPSYPSSHTLIFCCVMGTAMLQARRISNSGLRTAAVAVAAVIMCLSVIGRTLSGVHWLTDIIGGILLSAALIASYCAAISK